RLPRSRIGWRPARHALIGATRIDMAIAEQLILPATLRIGRAVTVHPEPSAAGGLRFARLGAPNCRFRSTLSANLSQVIPTWLAGKSARCVELTGLARGRIDQIHVREFGTSNDILVGSGVCRGVGIRNPPVVKLSIRDRIATGEEVLGILREWA